MNKEQYFEKISEYKLLAKHEVGQNFLIDEDAAERIVDLAEIDDADAVLEIGSGAGSLSFFIEQKASKADLIDIDEGLVQKLIEDYKDSKVVSPMVGNAMKWDYTKYTKQEMQAYAIAKNIKENQIVIVGTGLPLIGINHLEGQAKPFRIQRQILKAGRADVLVSAQSTHADTGTNQRPGFHPVHLPKRCKVNLHAHALQVDHLPAAHPLGAAGKGEFSDQVNNLAGIDRQLGQAPKRLGLQRIAREHRLGISELNVARGLAAAQHIIVHARQVIMNQGIGVNELNGDCSLVADAERSSGQAAGSIDKEGANPLSAAQNGIAHGFIQSLKPPLLLGQRSAGNFLEMGPQLRGPLIKTHFSRH